ALQALLGATAQLGELAELDRVGRAGLRARRLLVVLEAVVAERALPYAAVALALIEHAKRAGRHAVAAAVAHVLLHDDRAVLGAEQRACRAHLQAGGVGAVLADVRGHQPAHAVAVLVAAKSRLLHERIQARALQQRTVSLHPQLLALLDEGHVPPRVGAQGDR